MKIFKKLICFDVYETKIVAKNKEKEISKNKKKKRRIIHEYCERTLKNR